MSFNFNKTVHFLNFYKKFILRFTNTVARNNSTVPNSAHLQPLNEPISSIAKAVYSVPQPHHDDTRVTTLSNGLRVASQPKFGTFCTIGVLIDSGSRYEVEHLNGVGHFIEKLAFASTSLYPSKDEILQVLEQHGGICDCQGSRDTLIYAISAKASAVEEITKLLAEVTLSPRFSDEEIELTRLAIQFELESLDMKPDPETNLMEMIHAAAFNSNTIGLPKFCSPKNIPLINKSSLFDYLQLHHTPNRMVLTGVGVDHDKLVELAKNFFFRQPSWHSHKPVKQMHRDNSIAQYTGGKNEVTKDLSNVSLGPTPLPELAHFVIGLESCSHKDPDFVAFCVLNMLMGGGGSFSAGGPGKGMYTRLYLNVLNKYHWIHNATAFNHAYNDTGLFCIHSSAHPSSLKDLVEVIVKELVSTKSAPSMSELERAKTQLRSMLLMNLEARPVLFEDIGRQVLANGHRMPSQYYCDQINSIREEDIERVARRMLHMKPAVAVLGNLSKLPPFPAIQAAVASQDGVFSKRFSLF